MDAEEYENVRNETLMFFLDRLVGKGQPRTLHDLSCQFGTKGFTKEMRQIAGGSQAGLRKFLSQYPSLFTIVDDEVFITQLSSLKTRGKSRDYIQEAVDYFVKKLELYGDVEVPIRHLFGHRSQVPVSSIRHVSGQNVREFKEFLTRHCESFVVVEDHVALKTVVDRLGGVDKISRMEDEAIMVDPYLTQQLVRWLDKAVFMSPQHKTTIENLFNQLKGSQELWSKLVSSTADLTTILKMNSTSFCVMGREVKLTPAKIDEMRNVDKDSLPKDNGSNNKNANRRPSYSLNEMMKNKVLRAVADSNQSKCSLENNNLINLTTDGKNMDRKLQVPESPAINANSSHEYQSITIDASTADSSTSPPSLNPTLLLSRTMVIDSEKVAQEVMNRLTQTSPCVLAFDLEGVNLGKGGSITLIQVATMDQQVFLFDVLACPNLLELVFKPIFESEAITKVFHDCKNDSCALYFNHNITLKNVFDTQVAHAVIQQQTSGRAAYKLKSGSLNTLVEVYGDGIVPVNSKKDAMKKVYRRNNRYWEMRPLKEDMIIYAAADVYVLVPHLYKTMSSKILPEYQPLLDTMTHESIFSSINPDEVKATKKSRKTDLEIMDLKAKLYSTDKLVVLSNREIRLLRYLELSDEVVKKIEGSAKVAKKLERLRLRNSPSKHDDDEESSEEDSTISDQNDRPQQHNEDSIDYFSSISSGDSGNARKKSPNMATPSAPDSLFSSCSCCCSCSCHHTSIKKGQGSSTGFKRDAFAQTLSTGDIVITKVIFDEND